MIRSLVVASVTIVLVSAAAPFERLTAQSPSPPAQVPVNIVGGAPGTSLEVFLNAGKVADTTVGSAGDASWVLDLSNFGKQRMQTYVDVCQDGKRIKVLFDDSQPPPVDEGCNRRAAGGAWWSDCGATRITLDLTRFGQRIVGCGGMMNPKTLGIVGGAVGVGLLTLVGGGDGTSTSASTPSAPVTVVAPPVAPPPVAPPVANTTPPAQPTPQPPVTATGQYVCSQCSVRTDTSRHDPTLRLCSGVTATFNVIEGSLTIRHPSPFIDVSGASYNTSTGAFDLTGRGSIAGFNNVGVRAVGTVNNSTGRITFDYTMGTGGEFPGGQPITYSLTLQKR